MTRRRAVVLSSSVLALEMLMIVVLALADRRLISTGRGDVITTVYAPESWLLITGMLAACGVGCVVVAGQPCQRVGWLFIALSVALLAGGLFDEWYAFSKVGSGSLPGGDVAAALGDKSFIPWFTLITLILLLTPTGTYVSSRWRWVGRVSVISSCAAAFLSLVGDGALEGYADARNPFTVDALNPGARVAAQLMLLVTGGCLLLGGAGLMLRVRRSVGEMRRQLLWLVLAVVPLPLFVISTFVGAYLNIEWLTVSAAAGFVTVIPIAAGLSVLRYRLYDVERVVTTTLTYSLLTSALVGVYAALVWAAAQLGRGWAPSPAAAATLGAVAASLLAAPLRSGLQDRLDRRFDRRSYDARRILGAGLAVDRAGVDIEDLLRVATGDEELVVAFPTAGDLWLSATGASSPDRNALVEVKRGDRVVARIGFDPERTSEASMRKIATVAVVELDNARLLSELAAKVAEVEESRLRIARAQHNERRRIERDLHDGAQQTLLALAYRLQAAGLDGDLGRMQGALRSGAGEAAAAARELRALANGLHPQALAEGGLPAALDDLARSSAVKLNVTTEVGRVEPGVEFTTWMVIAEAVVNAQKHAAADLIIVDVCHEHDALRFRVADNGHGGADVTSSGLRGLLDRVETARGKVVVRSDRNGTCIEGTIPCAS